LGRATFRDKLFDQKADRCREFCLLFSVISSIFSRSQRETGTGEETKAEWALHLTN
jgi:hypothetical protein